MNIALCTDENFSIPALVCITSILENNKDEECHFYVLTDYLSEKARGKFDKLSAFYSCETQIITIDKHCFNGLTVSERFPVSMYYRFLLPEMLPDENKVLYLDCDIIVRKSLKEMYDTNLDSMSIAAVVGQSFDDIFTENLLQISTKYFNSGVLLMNLDYWRRNNIANKLIEWIKSNPEKCTLPDQNALNKVLEGTVVYLDYTYNFQEGWFGEMSRKVHFKKWDLIRKIAQDPTIVHFCEAEKPWFIECTNPYREDFVYFANKHTFIQYKQLRRYGFEYQCSIFVDKVGLKLRYWAELWQKHIISSIRIS